MSRPLIDLNRKIKDVLQHVRPLPDEAKAPILHYDRTLDDLWNTLFYLERAINQREHHPAVADRHLSRLYGMVLINLVETFERFLKEVAAECVNYLAPYLIDDRFNAFKIQGSTLASHFESGTMGKALCESATWLDCDEVNDRFRKLLADPFQTGGSFYLFPKGQQPTAEQWRYEPMSLIWQIRHTSVHNVGVITQSDAVKLRVLAKEPVAAPRLLTPTQKDLRYVKRFLDGTTEACNRRIGERLAELMTSIHNQAPALVVPADVANRLTSTFRIVLQIAGVPGVLPPD